MSDKEIKEKINIIKRMNLSKAFLDLFNKLESAYLKNEKTIVWTMIDNLYPSVKLENGINDEEKTYIKSFLLSF